MTRESDVLILHGPASNTTDWSAPRSGKVVDRPDSHLECIVHGVIVSVSGGDLYVRIACLVWPIIKGECAGIRMVTGVLLGGAAPSTWAKRLVLLVLVIVYL